MPNQAKKAKKPAKKQKKLAIIPGGSDAECREALAARLAAHIAEAEPVAEHASRADGALLALEAREEAEAARARSSASAASTTTGGRS